MNGSSSNSPSEETLRHQLEIQWQDHFQTRDQTWKTLQIEAAMFLAIIGADFKLSNPWLLIPLGSVLVISTIFGIAITIHHRKVQIQKFQFIYNFEEKLLLHLSDYMGTATKPASFKWKKVFDFKNIATPTFILMMHLLLLVFAVTYIVFRITEISR